MIKKFAVYILSHILLFILSLLFKITDEVDITKSGKKLKILVDEE